MLSLVKVIATIRQPLGKESAALADITAQVPSVSERLIKKVMGEMKNAGDSLARSPAIAKAAPPDIMTAHAAI